MYSEGFLDRIIKENTTYEIQLKNFNITNNFLNFYKIGYYNKIFVTDDV